MVLAVIAFFAGLAQASGPHVYELAVEYRWLRPGARLVELPNYQVNGKLQVSFGIELWDTIFWYNRVHSASDPSQFRLVGWETELTVIPARAIGWKWAEWLELFAAHHSQHVLDAEHPFMRFPVEDSFGCRIRLRP